MFLTECPRDAMQGWGEFIPTQKKIDYINALMEVGFDVLDCGSFVSPKAIPQMADTKDVIPEIQKKNNTKISVIVANLSGADRALKHQNIDILGFPFSISETFQYRNTNKNQEEAFDEVAKILEISKEEAIQEFSEMSEIKTQIEDKEEEERLHEERRKIIDISVSHQTTEENSGEQLMHGEIAKIVESVFDLRPYAIEQNLKLRNPIYQETASYGHMGRDSYVANKTFNKGKSNELTVENLEFFTWEKLDKVADVKKAFNL